MKYEIICALYGLVGATANKTKSEDTDKILLESLISAAKADIDTDAIVKRIHEELYRISPDCMNCLNPCGNTSDYAISLVVQPEESLKTAKDRMLLSAVQLAKSQIAMGSLDDRKLKLIYKSIAFFGYDLSVNDYEELIEALEEAKKE